MSNYIKILIADDNTMLRDGIKSLLKMNKDFVIVAEARNGEEVEKEYLRTNPDLMVVDISMPIKTGIQAISDLTLRYPEKGAKTIFFSAHDGVDIIYHSIKAGGKGFISKNAMIEELEFAIRIIADGGYYFGKEMQKDEINSIVEQYEGKGGTFDYFNYDFNEQELEVIKHLALGLNSEEIAESIFRSKKTIDNLRASITKKTGYFGTDLVKFAIKYCKIHI
jgi:DNA-binding NarL/FixJ family response regulator